MEKATKGLFKNLGKAYDDSKVKDDNYLSELKLSKFEPIFH